MMNYEPAKIRRFLQERFNDEELNHLCFDYFPTVHNDFTVGMRKAQKVQMLLEHCQKQGRWPALMAALERERSQAYSEEFVSTPKVETISSSHTPVQRDPRQIFISYAHQDVEFAQRLAADLKKQGWPVWIAPDSIHPGEKWVEAINRGLEESGIFLLVLTSDAVNSRWVQSETNIAIQWEHQNKMRFIPLRMQPNDVPYAPALWLGYQQILFDKTYQVGLKALLTELQPKPAKTPTSESTKDISLPPKEAPIRSDPVRTVKTPKTRSPFLQGFTSWPSLLNVVPVWGWFTLAIMIVGFSIWGIGQLGSGGNMPSRNAALHDTWTRPADGMVMVYVPGGTFMMGSNESNLDVYDDESPQHEVTLDSFWIDRTEVTNAQFANFIASTGYITTAEKKGKGSILTEDGWSLVDSADWRHPQGSNSDLNGLDEHPVVMISWYDANAYCTWAGVQLPTEAQWEYAARGKEDRIYPWGDESGGLKANYCDNHCTIYWKDAEQNDGYEKTALVGHYSPAGDSWVDATDMAGNVWEWVADWYNIYSSAPQINPIGITTGRLKVLRGGSWYDYFLTLRTATRLAITPDLLQNNVGFRCAFVPGS